MAPCRAGDALDVEGRRGDIETGIEAAAIRIFGARVDLEYGLDAAESGRPWIAAFGGNPIDLGGDGIDARLDATVPFFNGLLMASLAAGAARK
jgi:hypothetical protein